MTAPSVGATGQPARLGALDGLRGCAILMVIAAHAAVPQVDALGAAGVTVFFVLSGYLITSILLRNAAVGRGLGGFYGRRVRRLLPALLLLLVFESVLRIASGQSLVPVLVAAGYGTNVMAALGGSSTLDDTWSLALEEQFYLLWPLALPFVARRRRAVGLTLALAAASAIARVVVAALGYPTFAWFSPVTRADAILVGCALALAISRGRRLPSGAVGHVATAVALACLAVPFVLGSRAHSLWLVSVVAVATAVLVARLVGARPGLLGVVLSAPPLRWTGRISYSRYLWHPFALAVVISLGLPQRILATWAQSTGIATATWFAVERPFLTGTSPAGPREPTADPVTGPVASAGVH